MRRAGAASILLLALAACGDEPGLFELDAGLPTQDFADELDRLVPELLSETGVPGVGVALIENGQTVWMSGYGFADLASSRPVDPNSTVFQAASISKTLVAWTVMDLAEAGLIDLDVPIETYLTRWSFPEGPFSSGAVTARRLLSHTAGTSIWGYPGFRPGADLPSLEQSLRGQTNGQGRVEIEVEPATRWRYSGGGFTVLQLAIEEITGQPFADVVQARVLDPLGMASSAFVWREDLRERTATAYGEEGEALPNFIFVASASGGLYSTVADLAGLVEASLDHPGGLTRGRGIVDPETVDLMMTGPPVAVDYGLGHMLLTLNDSREVPGHAGINQGWRSFWATDPAQGLGIVVLSNSDHTEDLPSRILCAWTRSVLGAPIAAPKGILGCS